MEIRFREGHAYCVDHVEAVPHGKLGRRRQKRP